MQERVDTLFVAKRRAKSETLAKSRFLAVASHDLRQPLQTLSLLQGLLAKNVQGEKAQKLVRRLDETLAAMSSMLNTLLDINQIEEGTLHAEVVNFPIDDLLQRMNGEFTYHAQSKGIALTTIPCGLSVSSDPRLLEQMLRNLLANALKYTSKGKILLGCRRRGEMLDIEIWDCGLGIAQGKLLAIFEEYNQVDGKTHHGGRGRGLGLSIVKRLGALLDHRVWVRSQLNKGSVFAIEVKLAPRGAPSSEFHKQSTDKWSVEATHRTGTILVVEDNTDLREILEILLTDEGYRAAVAADGIVALELINTGKIRPDLIIVDYDLPNGFDGLRLTAKLRETLRYQVPAIILTGDISKDTLRNISQQHCVPLSKPANVKELTYIIDQLITLNSAHLPIQKPSTNERDHETSTIFLIDDDAHVREAIRVMLEEDGRLVEDYPTCKKFLEAYDPNRPGCLLLDASLPEMGGLELLQRLNVAGCRLPAIMITGYGDVTMAVSAMKAGVCDFIEKPVNRVDLFSSIDRALEQSQDSGKLSEWRQTASDNVASLTSRQRQIMELVLAGHPSKNIAADLGISQRTVENHRASIMKKTDSKSLPALARLALAAAWNGKDEANIGANAE